MSRPSEEELREAARRATQAAANDEKHAADRLRDALNEKR